MRLKCQLRLFNTLENDPIYRSTKYLSYWSALNDLVAHIDLLAALTSLLLEVKSGHMVQESGLVI